jgi:hypothetical protein
VNHKRPYRADEPVPQYLHEVQVDRGGKKHTLRKGMWVSVNRRPNLRAGQYEFVYAEQVSGTLLLYVEGPLSSRPADRRRKTLRETDIKRIHLKTGVNT